MGNKSINNVEDSDMEEWEGNKYSGSGIKKMKAYKCDLTLEELQIKREKFWHSKINNKVENCVNWSIIQKAISLDEPRNILYLQHFQIEPINGCVNECRDKDGNIYKIPNYCINDPYYERKLINNNINEIEEKLLNIKFYSEKKSDTFYLYISNKISGKNLKQKFSEHMKLNNNSKIRLFINGVELKDEEYLYQHNIVENVSILYIIKNYII